MQQFSARAGVTLPPEGHLVMSGSIFGCQSWGCSWHPVGRDTADTAQDGPHGRGLLSEVDNT